jgi:hypothetical protein
MVTNHFIVFEADGHRRDMDFSGTAEIYENDGKERRKVYARFGSLWQRG